MSVLPREGPRTFIITPDDRGGLVVVFSTLLMTWMVLCFSIRVYNRLGYAGLLGADDFIAGVATVSVATSTNHGAIRETDLCEALGCCADADCMSFRLPWLR